MKESLNYIPNIKYKVVGEILFSHADFSSDNEHKVVIEILNDSDTWFDNHWILNRYDADAITNIRKLEQIFSSSEIEKDKYLGTLLKAE